MPECEFVYLYPSFVVGRLHNSLFYLPDSAKLTAAARLVVRVITWGNLLDLIYDRSNILQRATTKACQQPEDRDWVLAGQSRLNAAYTL